MRVIWISVFLFLSIILLSLVLHDPGKIPLLQLSTPESPTVINPFIEDNVNRSEVELAALPVDEQAAQQQTESKTASPMDATLPAEIQANAGVDPGETDVQVATVSLQDNAPDAAEPASNISAVEATQAESVAPSKPLGLLARSMEQAKNQNKVAVIVHAENNQMLTVNEIRAMYQDRITRWQDGSNILLYNLPLGDSHREKFSRDILNMSALEADEAELQRREHNAAINFVRVKNKNIVVSYVEREPNAIAYVPLSMIRDKSNVKVVATLP